MNDGNERADWRAGMVAAPLMNLHITKGRKAKPSDWLFQFGPKIAESAESMGHKLKAFAMHCVGWKKKSLPTKERERKNG